MPFLTGAGLEESARPTLRPNSYRSYEQSIRVHDDVGTALEGINVTRRFQRILKRAGLPRPRFHDLRHAAASLLLAQGVNARVVMEILGHSQISLTLNTYSPVIPSLQREAASRMDAVLGKA